MGACCAGRRRTLVIGGGGGRTRRHACCLGLLLPCLLGLGGASVDADRILVSLEMFVPDVILGCFVVHAFGSELPSVGLPPEAGEFDIVPEVAADDVVKLLVLGV